MLALYVGSFLFILLVLDFIIYTNGKYRMWYVDNKRNVGHRNICYSESLDGHTWQNRFFCAIGKEINPWHIDVTKKDGIYYLTIFDLCSLTLWGSNDGISFEYIKEVLSPSLVYGSFYSDGLYRSSLIRDVGEFKLYFSSYNEKKTSIGLMRGKDVHYMTIDTSGECITV